MDISVLTEQRREMVINLLKGMKIRKSDGEGFDKDDVYASMQQLCDVYEKSIDDLTVGYETELSELQDKYQKYDENNDLYISLIMEAKKSSNEIINKAKNEVDEILAAGKQQIAEQEEEIEKCRAAAEQEKADLAAELEAARAAAEKEKADLAAQIEAEKKQSEATREQYRDQIAVMDQEFDEIKTNILRTAGKIDGLKAQLEESAQAPKWEVQDDPAPAEAPAAGLSIEEPAEEAPEELTFEELVAKLQREDAASAGPAEVEAPAEPPVVEPEIEVPAEPETEGFHFEPTFDTPAEPVVEIPAEPEEVIPEAPAVEVPEVEIPAEIPAEPEEIIPEIPEAEIPAVEIPEAEVPADIPELPIEEPAVDVPAQAAEDLASIEDLALEDISIDLPEEVPAEVPAEEPIEEISFEGLEELFKD